MNKIILGGLLLFLISITHAERVVNVYAWSGEIPRSLIDKFEKIYGIQVNFSTFDSNETMFAKLKTTRRGIYDVIMPSGYYVERMKRLGMVKPLLKSKIPNLNLVEEIFKTNQFDPGNTYSAPVIWGATGIFYNKNRLTQGPTAWRDLWSPDYKNQLMMLDDARELFSIALITLGYNPNDTDPQHIKEAYERLLTLVPNIKLFSSDNIQSIMIDEDSFIGAAWNGDTNKANQENKAITFVYPKEGYVIWVDCLAIPQNAPHPDEALEFINFVLSEEAGILIATETGYSITNKTARDKLPDSIKNNPILYPPSDQLKRGIFQRDVGEKTLALYNDYWQELKLAF